MHAMLVKIRCVRLLKLWSWKGYWLSIRIFNWYKWHKHWCHILYLVLWSNQDLNFSTSLFLEARIRGCLRTSNEWYYTAGVCNDHHHHMLVHRVCQQDLSSRGAVAVPSDRAIWSLFIKIYAETKRLHFSHEQNKCWILSGLLIKLRSMEWNTVKG